ncbi:MAG: MarR family transcriptional regulator [Myxococcota bacterium]|jgi:DNA-binding MarR family transcriptional regulator|nr:MarR family transcriptional regulator [Deltaproteobacteria bacterium]MCP4242118.1 MarR family transcriptional regulator [bacterium]MDP6075193.1 MarR family transcriptional regulator [Myxococcota bacterium]MDP6243828.1 MarR family transcriptional regulator [Myxococcota bacterium]MDP7075040.1 MarR family transcriptional regulator [Myxococcota bacterium]
MSAPNVLLPTNEIDEDMRLGIRLLAKLARIAEQACQATGISLPQYRLLAEVAGSPSRASALATRLAVSRPTLTSLVDGLETAGLLQRVPVPTDRRGIELRATDAGIAAVARAEAVLAERMMGLAGRTQRADVTGITRYMSSVLAQSAA